MKILALVLCLASLMPGQESDGSFVIRFEPTAVLQTNAEIPFEIHVVDALHKPLAGAKVTLQIATDKHTQVQVFKAPAVGEGIYVAKPVFPTAGQWNVHVEVRRGSQMSARTIEYNVPETPST